jgi:3-hydroxyisobutyrate dehydrogenase
VLAAGPEEVRERVAPLFDAVGARTLWLGAAGDGQRLKLVANTWVTAVVEGLAETLRLAEGLDVPPQAFLDAIAGGPLDAGYVQAKGRVMLERDFEPSFLLRHAAKDLRLIEEASAGLDLPLVAATSRRFAQAVEQGRGDLDMSAVYLGD